MQPLLVRGVLFQLQSLFLLFISLVWRCITLPGIILCGIILFTLPITDSRRKRRMKRMITMRRKKRGKSPVGRSCLPKTSYIDETSAAQSHEDGNRSEHTVIQTERPHGVICSDDLLTKSTMPIARIPMHQFLPSPARRLH